MKSKSLLSFIFVAIFLLCFTPLQSQAGCIVNTCTKCGCAGPIGQCQTGCMCASNAETGTTDDPKTTLGHTTEEFKKHREWMVQMFFGDAKKGDAPGLLAAMQLMTAQLTTAAMQQVQIIGSFFDAKHQLETQRLFQTLTARAHKDYQPSEALCEFGTMTRSLAESNYNTNITEKVVSKNMTQRQVLAKDSTAYNGADSDQANRLVNFIKTYCDEADNAKNLDLLCQKGSPDIMVVNKDINYTTTIDSKLTLDIDFLDDSASPSIDEKAVVALSQNLFAHSLFPFVSANKFVQADGETPSFNGAAKTYMDARAVMAKRSVAAHSFAAITALKTKGSEGAQPFIYALLKEMGGTELSAEEIEKEIGETPSYYAQMDVLTKKLYQRPEFYSDLYDKPTNVLRKNVALQAATLMQKRDLYESYLRSEMTLAVMLETLLVKEQDKVKNKMGEMR